MLVKLFDSLETAKSVLKNGKPRLARIENREYCLVREGSRIYVFRNACPHMGEQLHKGNINLINEIVCPLHTYRFNMDTGEESSGRCRPLKTFPVIEKTGGLYVEV